MSSSVRCVGSGRIIVKVVFRTDAGSQIGLGHLIRSIALAEALHSEGVLCEFLIRSATQPCLPSHFDTKFTVKVIPENIPLSEEPAWINSLLMQQSADAVLLDGYQFDQAYRQSLSEGKHKTLAFDDGNVLGQLHADLIINGADNAADLGYEATAKKAVKCLGNRYRVLRSEFSQLSLPQWETRKALTVIMGGSDPLNLTLPFLQMLNENQFNGPIQVITGAAYPYLTVLESWLTNTHLDVEHLHNCQQIAHVFARTRLAVSAAGGSQFELAVCATPAILALVADNQLNATAQAVKQGWCESVDVREHNGVKQLVEQTVKLWQDEVKLREMSERALATSDAKGGQRVARAIKQLLSGVNDAA